MEPVIQFEHVSKRYSLGNRSSLRETIGNLPKHLAARFEKKNDDQRDKLDNEKFVWALNDTSFEVHPGEAIGVVGSNGAGKSTLLKLIAGITRPTLGQVMVAGRVASMIELGAGFHPDLTGRENIYLNGALMGLSKSQIDNAFERIVAFAQLAPFIDSPVKRYSSGMYARLGFSVAAHSNPDILLVDEVLAVGDEEFQKKCYEFIHSFVNSGRTTVFVSHNLYAVEQLCYRLIWMDKGRIKGIGNPSRIVENYLSSIEENALMVPPMNASFNPSDLDVVSLRVYDSIGDARQAFKKGEDVVIKINFRARRLIRRPHFCIWISDSTAAIPLFAANMLIDNNVPDSIEGEGSIECTFKHVPLMPRTYYIWLEVYGEDRAELVFKWKKLGAFRIVDPFFSSDIEQRKGAARFSSAHAPIQIPYEWRILDDAKNQASRARTP